MPPPPRASAGQSADQAGDAAAELPPVTRPGAAERMTAKTGDAARSAADDAAATAAATADDAAASGAAATGAPPTRRRRSADALDRAKTYIQERKFTDAEARWRSSRG